jgi:hypothetical protein
MIGSTGHLAKIRAITGPAPQNADHDSNVMIGAADRAVKLGR